MLNMFSFSSIYVLMMFRIQAVEAGQKVAIFQLTALFLTFAADY